jgi:uncharacterized protein (DUF4415 family)
MAWLGLARRGRTRGAARLGSYAVAYAWRGPAGPPGHQREEEPMKNITRVSGAEARHLKDETDDARLDAMTDGGISQAVADDPDAPPLDIDWTRAELIMPPRKTVITMRVDSDVLAWFRGGGPGWQTRVNAVLRTYFEARRKLSR